MLGQVIADYLQSFRALLLEGKLVSNLLVELLMVLNYLNYSITLCLLWFAFCFVAKERNFSFRFSRLIERKWQENK